jgi:predicted Zn-dependent peptidase
VPAVSRDDVVGFAHDRLRPAGSTLIVAGDFEQVDLATVTRATLGGWTGDAARLVDPETPAVSDEPRIVVVDWPDAPQATVRIGGAGIIRSDPRWPAMFVANYAVGGSFGSRLNSVLREQKGFTYGVGSTLDTGRRVGLLGVGASVRSDSTAEAVGDMLSILNDARGSLSEEEIAIGVRAASDSAPLSFERAEAVVSRVEMLVVQGLPLDHVDVNLGRIREVTAEAANAVYSEVVHPETYTVVVAADAATAVSLEALDHAAVEVVSRPRESAS